MNRSYLVFKVLRQFKVYTAMFSSEAEASEFVASKSGEYVIMVLDTEIVREAA